MQQQTFAEATFEQYRKPTRRERFLEEMNRVVPWANWWRSSSRSIPRPRGRASAGGRRTDAAAPLPATVVQSVGSGRGGGPV
jgi:hypothetical protein